MNTGHLKGKTPAECILSVVGVSWSHFTRRHQLWLEEVYVFSPNSGRSVYRQAAMGSFLCCLASEVFAYETTKSVVVKSYPVGIINRVVQLLIIAYFVGWVFICEKAYQVTDTGIESSVMTKVKGFGYHHGQVMDVADYVYPPQGAAVFCIITKLIITEDQFQGRCPESGVPYNCTKDEDCYKYYGSNLSNGAHRSSSIHHSHTLTPAVRQARMESQISREEPNTTGYGIPLNLDSNVFDDKYVMKQMNTGHLKGKTPAECILSVVGVSWSHFTRRHQLWLEEVYVFSPNSGRSVYRQAAMGSFLCCLASEVFAYETTKSVVVKSYPVGIINRVVQLLIIAYFVGWVFICEKAYQVTDTGIESSVMTKVKGFGYHHGQVMDVADYVYPPQGAAVFCIITKLIITEDQFQGRCPESGVPYNCTKDEDCYKYYGSNLSNGVITGRCLNTSDSQGWCETEGWCPAEREKRDNVTIKPMLDVKNFTIFIKNSITFPLFHVTRGNFPSNMTSAEIKRCTYHPQNSPFCPIFRVSDVLKYTGQRVEDLAEKGGEIGINIVWKCNLDLHVDNCVPKYSFRRLDAPFAKNAVSKGYNFRFAKYYKTDNGTEFRTLYKAYAIRFEVMVTGNAGKFDTIPTLINLVTAFTSIGLGTVLCDIILLNFLKDAKQYKAKKFEEVSEAQVESFLAQTPGSQTSLNPGIKSSYDSGAISLSPTDGYNGLTT
ncbi:P2X purinoceptor 3a [Parambassis ranga]|uniref:P2X purinoceptor 3a n=1 Tax=Parambassis ranga TaxID=210632 RepID=A0A6P7J971_9TELE|nr:P2X purinoceptor 3-like [Parambassis ranga]